MQGFRFAVVSRVLFLETCQNRNMASVPVDAPEAGRFRRLFHDGRRVWLTVLVTVIVLCVIFLWATRDVVGDLSFLKAQSLGQGFSREKSLVDVSPWLTAQALSPLAVSREEKEEAREAERLADHEVDQAFALALRAAEAEKPAVTPEAKALTARVSQFEALVKQDQAQLASLTPASTDGKSQPAKAGVAAPDDDDVELAKAQLGLDTDQLNNAQGALARAVGDERARIQQELTAHQAVVQKFDSGASGPGETAVVTTQRRSSLASRISAWFDQRSRYKLLMQAEADAQAQAATLTAVHNALEAKADVSAAQQPDAAEASTASRLEAIKAAARQRQDLAIYDDRIQTEQQLDSVYAKWAAQVLLQHSIVLHLIVLSVVVIGVILLIQYFADMLIRYWTDRPGLDSRRQHTLRTILQVTLQLIIAVMILVVIFGRPEQLSTILGLATAGLTVALQSYILAFCGWFMLMGRNGIRVGDVIEINGVTGEVAEIGLFRTVLLETGNWTATGHPTGRLVAFMNTFAVTGQYFNFSTVGQWMWDEITVSIPASEETYSMIETIHKAVLKETAADVKSAEAEWKRASHGKALSHFSADPTMNLRPASSGVDVVVRYVTAASGRSETRNRLYQAVLDVLHQEQKQDVPETSAKKVDAAVKTSG